MSVNKCFHPDTGRLVPDLYNVCEDNTVVWLDEEFKRRREIVELSVQRLLRSSNCIVQGDGRPGRCDSC